jgi:ataxia telangiectasia mutated family protein
MSGRNPELHVGLVQRLKSHSRKDDRQKAVAEFKSDSPSDKAWKEVFEELIDALEQEKAAYLKSSKSVHSRLLKKLIDSANGFQDLVEGASPLLRQTRVKAILQHIMRMISLDAGRALFEPILVCYLKTLNLLLDFTPHVEHLRDLWSKVLSFCLEVLDLLQDGSQNMVPGAAEAISCIYSLCKASNAPLLWKGKHIIDPVIKHLRLSSSTLNSTQVDALAILSTLASVLAATDIKCTQKLLRSAVPLFPRLWSFQSPQLRDQILVFFIHTAQYIRYDMRDNSIQSIEDDLENLLTSIYQDLITRQSKDRLQLNDIQIHSGEQILYPHLPTVGAFSLRRGNLQSEGMYMTLYTIAWLAILLDDSRAASSASNNGEDNPSSKRRRIATNFDDHLHYCSSTDVNIQATSLQILSVMAILQPLTAKDMIEALEYLMPVMSHANSSVASWAFLTISNLALQISASDGLGDIWLKVCDLAFRSVSAQATARASSSLLDILLRRKLIPVANALPYLESILHLSEITGPGVLADSTVSFWTTIATLLIQEQPASAKDIHEKILRWMFNKWSPSSFDDNIYLRNVAANLYPIDLLKTISLCANRNIVPFSTKDSPFPTGPISDAWSSAQSHGPLTQYLLVSETSVSHVASFISTQFNPNLSRKRESSLYSLLIDFCNTETIQVKDKIDEMEQQRFVKRATPEVVQLLSGLLLVINYALACPYPFDQVKLEELKLGMEKLSSFLIASFTHHDADPNLTNAILLSLIDVFPELSDLNHLSQSKHLLHYLTRTGGAVSALKLTGSITTSQKALDSMDIDLEFFSPAQSGAEISPQSQNVRTSSTPFWDMDMFRSCCEIFLRFLTMLESADKQSTIKEPVSTQFLEYVLNLPPDVFFSGWKAIHSLVSNTLTLDTNEKVSLLEHASDLFMTQYQFERNEIALSACLELLEILVDDFESLGDITVETYEWYLQVAVKNELLSNRTNLKLVDFLFALTKRFGPLFKPGGSSVPTIQDILLELLNVDIVITYHIIESLPTFVAKFPLEEHEQVFEQICQKLPIQQENIETLAVRLLCISNLASHLQTLLRRSIYRIFESAGQVAESIAYATTCISKLCTRLSIANGQELFRSLAAQIIFTWLQAATWSSIPYSIFQYDSLNALLLDIEDEATAQAFINENESFLEQLSEILEIPISKLCKDNFARIAAYSFATDEQARRADGSAQGALELKLRSILDPKVYPLLIKLQYPLIVSIMFASTRNQQDSAFVKMLSRETANREMTLAMSSMSTLDDTADQIISDQQPNFRLSWVVPCLPRICRRINLAPEKLWSEALYAYTLRYHLHRINPFLGSLHAFAIIRRIRVLVAMAAKSSSSGYAIQMTLQSLQPFLNDEICSGVTISIVKYLLEAGYDYLSQKISFVTGYLVSTKLLIKSTLLTVDSTPQEKNHVTKLNHFKAWMDNWSRTYTSNSKMPAESKAFIERLKELYEAASNQKSLLQTVLNDQTQHTPLLPYSSRQNIITRLCADFEPVSAQTQSLIDQDNSDLARNIWSICRSHIDLSDEFLLWAGRVIGQMQNLAGSSRIVFHDNEEVGENTYVLGRRDPSELGNKSSSSILNALTNTLQSDNAVEAGFAEQALRTMVNSRNQETQKYLASNVDVDIIRALSIGNTSSPVVMPAFDSQAWYSQSESFPEDLMDWLKDTIIYYMQGSKNQLLTSLHVFVIGVPRFSIELFPQILHLLLLETRTSRPDLAQWFSSLFTSYLSKVDKRYAPAARIVIQGLLYLRSQPKDRDSTLQDSWTWLNVDPITVARAAEICGMFATALLFAETALPKPTESLREKRRSQVVVERDSAIPTDLLLSIYRNINEPDSYYGVHQSTSLTSVIERLRYEDSGYKSLIFNGASLDSKLRRHEKPSANDHLQLFEALTQLNLNSVALAISQSPIAGRDEPTVTEGTFTIARKLEQWDIGVPEVPKSDSDVLLKAFQELRNAVDVTVVNKAIDSVILIQMQSTIMKEPGSKSLHNSLATLGVLGEIDLAISGAIAGQLVQAWESVSQQNAPRISTQ